MRRRKEWRTWEGKSKACEYTFITRYYLYKFVNTQSYNHYKGLSFLVRETFSTWPQQYNIQVCEYTIIQSLKITRTRNKRFGNTLTLSRNKNMKQETQT